MNFQTLQRDNLLFDPKDFGKIFAFIDFSNVRHWAKSFWPTENQEHFVRDIDIQKLAHLNDLVGVAKKFFYYGHYRLIRSAPEDHPLNRPYRQSTYRIDRARKAGFTTRTKEIKTIETFDAEGRRQGTIHKCNFDVEITMDMIKQSHKYDTVLLWSGDSDFGPLLDYLKSKGKKTITVCARDFASKELQSASDRFVPADPLRDQLEYIPHK